jgi:uncharacterized protein
MKAVIPTADQCILLMERYGMLPNIKAHSIVVEKVAFLLAQRLQKAGEDLVLEAVTAGALMHDIAKTECLRTKENHAEKGKEICLDLRLHEIADIVAEHIVLTEFRAGHAVREKEIVYYADKRVNHDVVVSLDERLQYLLEHYGRGRESIEELIRNNFELCRAVEKKIFSRLSFRPEEVSMMIGQQANDILEGS